MDDLQIVKKKLKEAFDLVADSLVADSLVAAGYSERVKDVYELVDANESVIALENLCESLYEFECRIPVKAYELFAEAGIHFKIDSKCWEMLKPYIVE
jgi:hypothetical protein